MFFKGYSNQSQQHRGVMGPRHFLIISDQSEHNIERALTRIEISLPPGLRDDHGKVLPSNTLGKNLSVVMYVMRLGDMPRKAN